ncbi:GTP-binding protein 10 homolog [Prorops nasuta]|uniref:GTP-binding protein 10 homolog n=1 Tax=Prorops nasuta TaxID=863751 RepID=UPI0034CE0F13
MVYLTPFVGYAVKTFKKGGKTFLDSLTLYVKAGNGGAGLPRYGGIGGSGGNVFLVPKEEANLLSLKKKATIKQHAAGSGGDSSRRGIIGEPGKDLMIEVPCGVSVYSENGVKLGEVNTDNDKLLVARGGLGGREETGFCGEKGQAHRILLDLKLIADVGLIGFPNAGKSTFLKAMSNAKPKIASYPFTTIMPQLGTIVYKDGRCISVADLPGLIEGAHKNIGMGHTFLKHIQRTKLLIFIVDIQGFRLSLQHNFRSCLETIVLLNKEIELYKPDLLNMPCILILNKMDTNNASHIYEEIKSTLKDMSSFVDKIEMDIRPEKLLTFDQIFKTTLKDRKSKELVDIKECIRNVLDSFEERKNFESNCITEKELLNKIKNELRLNMPTAI